jgi:hypothetical protein
MNFVNDMEEHDFFIWRKNYVMKFSSVKNGFQRRECHKFDYGLVGGFNTSLYHCLSLPVNQKIPFNKKEKLARQLKAVLTLF